MGLYNSNSKDSPATGGTLSTDLDGEDCNEGFNYASILGMLLYLQGHTRLAINFTVNQYVRYAFSPRLSQEEGMKYTGRYLKCTCTKCIIMKLTKNLQIDCSVYTDFAGPWGYDGQLDPTSVKRRSGFLNVKRMSYLMELY